MNTSSKNVCSLDKSVKKEINLIKHRVKESRLAAPNKKHCVHDYPSAVVACKCRWKNDVYCGESRSPVNYQY